MGMTANQESVTAPPTLMQHLKRKFDEANGGPLGYDEGNVDNWVVQFVEFCDAEMARNGVTNLGYADAGITAQLQDRTTVLLSPTQAHASKASGVYALGRAMPQQGPHASRSEPFVTRITGAER